MHPSVCQRSHTQPYGQAQRMGWWWVYENCEDTNLWRQERYDSSRISHSIVWASLAGEEICIHTEPCPEKGSEMRGRLAAVEGGRRISSLPKLLLGDAAGEPGWGREQSLSPSQQGSVGSRTLTASNSDSI